MRAIITGQVGNDRRHVHSTDPIFKQIRFGGDQMGRTENNPHDINQHQTRATRCQVRQRLDIVSMIPIGCRFPKRARLDDQKTHTFVVGIVCGYYQHVIYRRQNKITSKTLTLGGPKLNKWYSLNMSKTMWRVVRALREAHVFDNIMYLFSSRMPTSICYFCLVPIGVLFQERFDTRHSGPNMIPITMCSNQPKFRTIYKQECLEDDGKHVWEISPGRRRHMK